VPREKLEARVFGAIHEQILTPENTRYVIDQALDRVSSEPDQDHDLHAVRKRLDEIEVETDRAARLAVKAGEIEMASKILAELDDERRDLEAQLRTSGIHVDLDALRARAEAKVADFAGLFADAETHGRAALRALLDGRRMRVGPHAAKGFQVEGVFSVYP
jgi:hypothetical protein